MSGITVSGYVVGLREREYDAFEDGKGGTMPAGISRRVWIAPMECDDAPFVVKVSDAQTKAIRKAGPFAHIECRVSLGTTLNCVEVLSLTASTGETAVA